MIRIKLILTLLFSLIITSIYGQKSNMYVGSSISSNPKTFSMTFHYVNPSKDIMREIIELFGESMTNAGGIYNWEDQKVKGLSRRPLDIKIVKRRYDYPAPKDDHEYYDIYIKKKNKDFLKEIKFINRLKVKKIFMKFAEIN